MFLKIMNSVSMLLLAVGLFCDFNIQTYAFVLCNLTYQILVKLQEEK